MGDGVIAKFDIEDDNIHDDENEYDDEDVDYFRYVDVDGDDDGSNNDHDGYYDVI